MSYKCATTNDLDVIRTPTPPPPDPFRHGCKRQLEKIINDGPFTVSNVPENLHEPQQLQKKKIPNSAFHRIFKRILRCIRGPKPEYVKKFEPESYSEYSSEEKGHTWTQNISPQKQCSLFNRIPLEVRQQIYKELFCNLVPKWHLQWPVEVFQPKGKGKSQGLTKQIWCHSPCPKRYLPNNPLQWCLTYEEHFLSPDHSTGIELSLLFTCRQAYIEVSPLIYSNLVFGLDSPLALRKLTSTLSTPLLHTITSLDLEWEMNNTTDVPSTFGPPYRYSGKKNLETSAQPQTSVAANLAYKRLWELLARFEGLKRLRVRIYTHHDRHRRPTFGFRQGFERLWLDPLSRFERLETFCLAINEPFFGMLEKERERMGWGFRIVNIRDGHQRGQDDYDDEGSGDDY